MGNYERSFRDKKRDKKDKKGSDPFFRGTVVRSVYSSGFEIYIRTHGSGAGIGSSFNDFAGPRYFRNVDENLIRPRAQNHVRRLNQLEAGQ